MREGLKEPGGGLELEASKYEGKDEDEVHGRVE